MLARNAESLFWIGRYVERADDTARILDVGVHQLLEDATADADQQARSILRTLGITPPEGEELGVWPMTELVAFNRETGDSIADALYRARENARGAREVTSTEMWECLNTTFNGIADSEKLARKLGPHEFFSYVENRSALFSGLVDATLSRDDGYLFLLLGKHIERIDMIIRLLLVGSGDRSDASWVSVLRAAGAHDTYLRTYRGVLNSTSVVEFLVLDRLFPRSVFYSLRCAEECLAELDRGDLYSRVGSQNEARRIIGGARSELEYTRATDLVDDLYARLSRVQTACLATGEAVAERYFTVEPYMLWSDVRAIGRAGGDLESETGAVR